MTQSSIDNKQLTLDDIDTNDYSPQYLVLVHRPIQSDLDAPLRECLAAANMITNGAGLDVSDRVKLAHGVATGDIDVCDDVVSIQGGGLAVGTSRFTISDLDSVEDVVVDNIATLGRSYDEIADLVQSIIDAGAVLHLMEEGVTIDSQSGDAVLGVLDALDTCGVELMRETQMRDVQEWCGGIDRDRGRPSLGFTYNDDGNVVPADNIDEVRAVLSMARAGPDGERELSKRKAAERLDVSSRTIGRALDNLDRYGLDDEEEAE